MPDSTRPAKSRDGVVAAAQRVLRERGLHRIRVRDVAAAGGMSPGAVLYHYRTTDELLLAVHEQVQRQYLERRTDAARRSGGDAWARLMSGFKTGLPPYTDSELIELLYEMHGLTRRSPRHAVLLTDLWEVELAIYQETITAGVEEGLFNVTDMKAAARALLALEDGLALHLVSDNGSMNSPIALNTFISAAATILGNPALAARARPQKASSPGGSKRTDFPTASLGTQQPCPSEEQPAAKETS